MSVSTTNISDTYTGNGSTASFLITFDFLANDQIRAKLVDINTLVETALTEGIDYTLVGGNPAASVSCTTIPSATDQLVIYRATPKLQTVDYIETGAFPAEAHEKALDKIVMMIQEGNTSTGTTTPTNDVANGRNYILNGAMYFDQNKEGGVYTSSASEVYSLDQWRYSGDGGVTGVFTVQRSASTAPGFPYSLNMTTTTQQLVLPASSNFHLEYPIESNEIVGFKWGTSEAKDVVISFWAKASTAGEYSLALMEGTNSRSYVTSFTISVADVWEKVGAVITGDTGGTWQTAYNTFGVKLLWSLGVGSTYTTSTTETWQVGSYWNKTGTQQLIQKAAANNLCITGVQLEIGTTASDFKYLPLSQELLNLQRYYFKTFPQGTAVAQNAGSTGALSYVATTASTTTGNGVSVRYPVRMASSAPTLTFYNPSAANAKWRALNGSAADSGTASTSSASDSGVMIINPQVAGTIAAEVCAIHMTANARLGGG